MRCAECWAEIAEAAAFCARCGAPAAGRPSPVAGGLGDALAGDPAGPARFSITYLRPGYDMEQVDVFLAAIRDTFLGIREPPLTADEIRNEQFLTTRLRRGYDEEEVDTFLDEVEARLRSRCAECGVPIAEVAQFCVRCGAPAVRQPPMAANPAGGQSGDSAAIAAARDTVPRPARARLLYLLMFVVCCLITFLSGYVGGKLPSNSSLAGVMGGTVAFGLTGVVGFPIAFVRTLSQRRRRRVRQVAWALVPIVSFTVLAWWPFLVLALIRRRVRDWAVFAAYLAAVAAEAVLLILGVAGILPASGVAGDVWVISFLAMVLLVAAAAPIHTLVAFRPAAGLPSLPDAERARGAAKRRPQVIDAGGPRAWPQDAGLDH